VQEKQERGKKLRIYLPEGFMVISKIIRTRERFTMKPLSCGGEGEWRTGRVDSENGQFDYLTAKQSHEERQKEKNHVSQKTVGAKNPKRKYHYQEHRTESFAGKIGRRGS